MLLINLLSFFIVLVSYTECVSGQLSWHHLVRDNFTDEHNWEMVKAHIKNDVELMNLLNRPETKNISVDHTIFTLYNRNGPEKGVRIYNGDVASLIEANFDKSKQVFFATHGFLSGGDVSWMLELKSAHLNAYDCNFVTIDWSSCAGNIFYPTAKDCTQTVGAYLADVIKFLGAQGADISGMHLMGHSLGAHIMAQVSQHNLKVSRITGMDPAGPLFDDDELGERLDPSDAVYVDIIHTNMNTFGYEGILGHADFFPNGGNNQPGCLTIDMLCSHSKSHQYYTESVIDNFKFPSLKCDSMDSAKDGNCAGEVSYMGVLSTDGPHGIYYTKVEDASRLRRA